NGDVTALGSAIRSALAKWAAEELAQLRAQHEVTMTRRMLDIRKERINEAKASLESIQRSLHSAFDRQEHSQTLLDVGLLPQEEKEGKKIKSSHEASMVGGTVKALASILSSLPQVGFNGPIAKFEIGGMNFGPMMNAIAEVSSYVAEQHAFEGQMQGREAGHIRRRQDWAFQKQLADRDIARLGKDQIAAEIRLAIAEKELADQEKQIAHAEEAAAFLDGKFTNAELYGWMSNELAGLHYQAYKLAHEMAKQAEACMKFELEKDDAYIEFGHWDGMRKGLLAGERLTLDLRRLEAAYIADNKRSQELTKTISLARLDPAALLDLQTNDEGCSFEVSEFLFDLDHPGHYMRRIKSVSLTIPAVAGPQTTISCSLKLENSMVRTERFVQGQPDVLDFRSSNQVISTSGAQNDAGLFQLDFRDERYLPFEGMGAVSRWKLQLPPKSLAQFDYSSISDVILQIRYTSEVSEASRGDVIDKWEGALNAVATSFASDNRTATPLARLFSLRFDFPVAWAQAVSGDDSTQLSLDLSADRFPYLFTGRAITINKLKFDPNGLAVTLEPDQAAGVQTVSPSDVLSAIRDGADDIPLIVEYGVAAHPG
ncbi:MAG: hypothetical protein AAFO72_07515, partial [Pseudomonadota bacterium]